jgi:NAD(P)H-nitrite reductase large subunit
VSYVIIGNSVAAAGCIEGIRLRDKTTPITVLSAEKRPIYARPLISYLLQGKTDEARMSYRPADFYARNKCALRTGVTATRIDAAKKQVALADGERVPYGKLLVATGSRPFVPPADGLEKIKYFTFMTLDSAKALEAVLSPDTRVLIVGAGLIGMKCAEGIAERSGSVAVVEMQPRVLPTVLDAEGAAIIQKQMEAHRVRFYLGDSVKTYAAKASAADGTEAAKTVCTENSAGAALGGSALLASGKTVDFDVLIMAVGVRPNTQLVADAGGKVERGIVVDEHCRTSIPDVYAAGDCTESDDISFGGRRILALLPNAYMQGEAAGISMSGGEKPFITAFPLNAAGFFGLHLVTAGSYAGEMLDIPAAGALYRKFFVKDDLLKGFIIIGEADRAGIYTALIRDKTPLSSIDFDLIKAAPALMAFSKARREEILAGRTA